MEQITDSKRLIKEENRIAANWLIYYRERKREHEEQRVRLLEGTKGKESNVGGRRPNRISRPTEELACKLEAHEHGDTAKWLLVVEEVKKIVGPKKRLLIELRQECKFYISPEGGRPGWIVPVQIRFGEMTGWCPAERTIQDMWRDVVYMAVRIAFAKKCHF
jgi:hypothetical protein